MGHQLHVYLDNSATTPICSEVLSAIDPYWQQRFANPSSPHHLGVEVDRELTQCRQYLAQQMDVAPRDLIFTASGTESNNLAIQGFTAHLREPAHIITTATEHASVLHVIKHLVEAGGCDATFLPVNANGAIDISQLKQAIRPTTRLVSIMAVNNEIGTIQPIADVGSFLAAENQQRKQQPIIFHVDGVQAIGKIPLRIKDNGIHLFTISAHKIQGPKGSGLLYCHPTVRLAPIIHGGGQEGGLRSGTENIPAIVGLTKSVQLALENIQPNTERLTKLRQHLIDELATIADVRFNSPQTGAPHIVNIQFVGVKGEVLVNFLEQQGVYVSMGAACTARKQRVSHVLQAIGLTPEQAGSSIRISLSPTTTMEEIGYAVHWIKESVTTIRDVYS